MIDMEKMELYHLHKKGNHDKLWHEKSTIKINENFKNAMYQRYQNFSTGIPIEGGGYINLYDLILAMKQNNLTSEIVNNLINYSYHISFYASEFKRETALENYRLHKNYTYPSRLHSIYLTDELGIESWCKKLGGNLELFRVEVEGNIFKTSEFFIPDETLSYEQAFNESFHYWNPNFKKAPNDANEYLIQGNIKVLEKIRI